jgi:hypothetical protein
MEAISLKQTLLKNSTTPVTEGWKRTVERKIIYSYNFGI